MTGPGGARRDGLRLGSRPSKSRPLGGGAGALADDERGLGNGMGAGERIAPHAEDFEGPPTKCSKVEPDGGQRGHVVRRIRRVIEPDHAELTGNPDLQVMGSTQDAQSLVVVT